MAKALRKVAAIAAAIGFLAAPAFANPDLSADFGAMAKWLSHDLAQGIGFNAGGTFDPPHEVISRRLQPDISVGVGSMPLDKTRFPDPQTPSLKEMDAAGIFPNSVIFPNFTMHMRAGLPGRMDMSIRLGDMTTPKGYRVSPSATGNGQSNSIGVGLRRHFFGGPDRPMLSLGGQYNHVYGRFNIHSKFNVNDVAGYSSDSDVNGYLSWNVSSLGFNAVLSQTFRSWTPFFGAGYNYVTGSVHSRLEAIPSAPGTFGVAPILGEFSEHPEQNQIRVLGGLETDIPWMHLFANGEVKAMGEHALQSWILQIGGALPFEIGPRTVAKKSDAPEQLVAADGYGDYGLPLSKAKPRKEKLKPVRPYLPAASSDHTELIFLQ